MASNYSVTSQWIRFFSQAGLPSNVAANYAIIFTDNRIQMDMLMDLSKEYLYDMGIRVMGDVIAILRHAKEMHNQLTKEKVMADISETPPSMPKRNTTVKRMLGHYTRPSISSTESSPSGSLSSPKKMKLSPVTKDKSMVVCLKRSSSETSAETKKLRTVLPAGDDVTYEVKLPLGTTPRSRKLLQLQKEQQQQRSKKSVFQRLGDSAVSSTTDLSGNKNSPVFGRLGASNNNEVSTSTSGLNEEESDEDEPPLKYQGILKGLSSKRTIVPNRQLQNSLGVVRRVQSSNSSIMQRLGPKPTSVSTVSTTTTASNRTVLPITRNKVGASPHVKTSSQGIFGNRMLQNANVKSRLGFKAAGHQQRSNIIRLNSGTKVSSTNQKNINSVFQRLGH